MAMVRFTEAAQTALIVQPSLVAVECVPVFSLLVNLFEDDQLHMVPAEDH